MKARRKEEESVKIELGLEQARMKNLESVELKRRKVEEKRKKQDLRFVFRKNTSDVPRLLTQYSISREFLSRQHRLKLLAKAVQVQKDLEDDKKLLEEMEAFSKTHDEQSIREREEKNQRLTWMKNVIDR